MVADLTKLAEMPAFLIFSTLVNMQHQSDYQANAASANV